MIKKEDYQKNFNHILVQAKDGLKKFGKELNILARKSEKEIVKASKTGKIQLDIMGLTVRKEKLYYDIGKKAASLNAKKSLEIPELESYWKRMERLEEDTLKKKEALKGSKP